MTRVLIIDDDRPLCRSLELQLQMRKLEVRAVHTGRDGLAAVAQSDDDLILLDLKLPDIDGLQVLAGILKHRPEAAVAVITGKQDMQAAITAMREGALDYLRKPFELDEIMILLEKVRRQCGHVRNDPTAGEDLGAYEIIGSDKQVVHIIKQIGLLSRNRVSVLIEGESGTGKELVARALHQAATPQQPFVAINCSAVVGSLFESELFGHEKGAFTGAGSRKTGKLEFAGTGTVFLDEIGDIPLEIQAKILRVLQEQTFERVGGLEPIRLRARIVAATHRDLDAMVTENRFRQDLFFRLAVARINIPPLRERLGDLPQLVLHLHQKICRQLHVSMKTIPPEMMSRLQQYSWPGNIRELENVLSRSIALAQGDTLQLQDFKPAPPQDMPGGFGQPVAPLRDMERDYIRFALDQNQWNITHTADQLQISPTTLRKKIKDYGLAV